MKTITLSNKNTGISSIKANRLYWMGRYAERVYLALHMLRKHYDLMIDEDDTAYKEFCQAMGIANRYKSAEDFIESYLYSPENEDSILSMLEHLNDNAILLREEIKSETLSYIQLALNYMKSPKAKAKGLGHLQYITDCMLAFWGSIDERIYYTQARHIILFGKFVECMDILIRFDYPQDRIMNPFNRLKEYYNTDCKLFDKVQFSALEDQLYLENHKSYETLVYLNGIFTA